MGIVQNSLRIQAGRDADAAAHGQPGADKHHHGLAGQAKDRHDRRKDFPQDIKQAGDL